MKNNRVLITGGSGFIGTNLVEYYLSKGYEVLNIDINAPKIESRGDIWKKIDIRKKEEVIETIVNYNPDYVIHLAARTDLNGVVIDDYDSNIIGVGNIIEACSNCKNLKKIIITSSMLVCRVGYIPENQFDYNPSTLYGESKVLTEKIVWDSEIKCDWAIIRPTSIWGPWFGVPYRDFFDRVINKKYFHIGNKSCTKTYGYIGNAVYQIYQIMINDTFDENKKIFYIGDYEPTAIEKWGNEIAQELGYKILKVPFWSICCAAFLGDCLKKIGVPFPMTSFRLKNMTTDNIVNTDTTEEIANNLPYSRVDGVKETLKWML